MIPTVGQFVRYTLSSVDVDRIKSQRLLRNWEGNQVEAGQIYPMLIVRTWGVTPESSVNGQVFLDGNDVFWVTSRSAGEGPGHFA